MTITLSQNLNCNYFEILQQDTDDVIFLINYFVELGSQKEEERPSKKDDGFWDF